MNGNISKLNIVLVGNYEIGKSIIKEFNDENKRNFFLLYQRILYLYL